MKHRCVSTGTTTPADRWATVCSSRRVSVSFPDLQLPSGSRHEPRIRLLTDVMAKRARSSLWRGSQQPNAVNAPERPCHVSGNPKTVVMDGKPVGRI